MEVIHFHAICGYSIDCVEVPRSSLLMYIDCVYCIVLHSNIYIALLTA